jgi:hypothetical protein
MFWTLRFWALFGHGVGIAEEGGVVEAFAGFVAGALDSFGGVETGVFGAGVGVVGVIGIVGIAAAAGIATTLVCGSPSVPRISIAKS